MLRGFKGRSRVRLPSLFFDAAAPSADTADLLAASAMQRLEVALDAFGQFGCGGPPPAAAELQEMLMKIAHHEARGWVGKRTISEEEIRSFVATPEVSDEAVLTFDQFLHLYNDLLDWCQSEEGRHGSPQAHRAAQEEAMRASRSSGSSFGRRLSGQFSSPAARVRRTSWTSKKKASRAAKEQPGMTFVASRDDAAVEDEVAGVSVGKQAGQKNRKELAQKRLKERRPSIAMQARVKVAGSVSDQQQDIIKAQVGGSGANRIDFTQAGAKQRARAASITAKKAQTGGNDMAASNMAAAMAASQAAKVGLPMDPAMEAAAAAAMVPEEEDEQGHETSFKTAGSLTFTEDRQTAQSGTPPPMRPPPEAGTPPPKMVLTDAVVQDTTGVSPEPAAQEPSPPPEATGEAAGQAEPAEPAEETMVEQPAERAAVWRRRSSEQRRPSLGHRNSVAVSKEMGQSSGSLSFDPSSIGTYSCRGMEDGVVKTNQDCACIAHPFAKQGDSGLFCVFDGHGKDGHNVSREALNTIYGELYSKTKEELRADTGNIMAGAFEAAQAHLDLLSKPMDGDEIEVDSRKSGACGLVVYAHGSTLWVGGVGDCRAVLALEKEGVLAALSLSTDHKVDLEEEQKRIESMGGYVKPAEVEDGAFNPARLYQAKNRPWLGPGLCVARALGDLDASCCGLIPTPEVVCHSVTADDKFLILATDGVWEFIENEEAVRLVNIFYTSGKTAEEACRFLIASAAMKWREYEGDYRDDITCIVLYLPAIVATLEVNGMPKELQ